MKKIEQIETIPESPKSVAELLVEFQNDFGYGLELLAGTDVENNHYVVQFSLPLESSNVPNNQIALTEIQNQTCAQALRKDLHEKCNGEWSVQTHTGPVHISIEQLPPVEEAED